MKLVVIEGPGKQATIEKYLGKEEYKVFATKGHIRDLPAKKISIDIDDNFKPHYEPIPEKKKIISELQKLAKQSDEIYLATDPDREGEAISWHLAYLLNLDEASKCRITFNEISKKAVEKALLAPRCIDKSLVDAQQARRVLDRLVGYMASPVLNKAIAPNLSAGRVQSVALKLVVDREREILNFVPEEFWTLTALLNKESSKFKANLTQKSKNKIKVKSKDEMDVVLKDLEGKDYIVSNVKRENKKFHAPAPFITSSMQQDAGSKLKMPLAVITKTAQSLYEGVQTKEFGKIALITYIRTDSTRVSQDAMVAAKAYIKNKYGDEYAPASFNIYASKASAQEGHEAIRPIDISLTPDKLKGDLTKEQLGLYTLIYNRFLASQMTDAVYDTLTVDIDAGDYTFRATGRSLIFDGYRVLYNINEDEEEDGMLPNLNVGDKLNLIELKPEQKFTKPPQRYTEPSFIKTMENVGIGRPATYAQTVAILFQREYCEKDGKNFKPTEMGFKVCDFLCEHFPDIMNVEFTADLEEKLDTISNGQSDWVKVVADFYVGFEKELAAIGPVRRPVIETDEVCEKCGAKMVIRTGSNGRFLACSAFPKCRNTKSIDGDGEVSSTKSEPFESDEVCEICGEKMLIKEGKNGKFLACSAFPNCKNTRSLEKCSLVCEKCGKPMQVKTSKSGKFYACSGYPDCKNIQPYIQKVGVCEKCGKDVIVRYTKSGRKFYACLGYPNCDFVTNKLDEVKKEK